MFTLEFLLKLGIEIEEMLLQQQQQPQQNHSMKKQFIHQLCLVEGIPFYGYYPNEKLFIKIILYNPQYVSKIAAILQSGSILNRKFQPYEAHIPHSLQFFIDYNLYGMGNMFMNNVIFRHPLPLKRKPVHIRKGISLLFFFIILDQKEIVYIASTVSNISDKIPRISSCELEVDVDCKDILNRLEINATKITSTNKDIKLVQSLNTIWEEEKSRRRAMNKASQPTPVTPSQTRIQPSLTEIEKAMYSHIHQLVSLFKYNSYMK